MDGHTHIHSAQVTPLQTLQTDQQFLVFYTQNAMETLKLMFCNSAKLAGFEYAVNTEHLEEIVDQFRLLHCTILYHEKSLKRSGRGTKHF